MLTRKQASEYLGISSRTLDRYCDMKLIAFHQLYSGCKKMFTEKELDAFITRTKKGAKS